MMFAGEMKSLFGAIRITAITIVALGILETAAGKSGVISIKPVDGNIIKDGVIN